MCIEIIKSGSFISLLNNRVVSRSEMSRAHGSVLNVCFFLRCLCLMAWSHLALSCRVQNLHLLSLFAKNCNPYSLPCTGLRTVLGCPCPSPKGWCRADQGAGSVCLYFSLSAFCMVSLSRRGCRGAGGTEYMECVSESAWLPWCVHASCHGSADFSSYWLCSGFCCRSLVACCIIRAAWVGGGT